MVKCKSKDNNCVERGEVMTGQEIRSLILESGLKLWQVADELGMNDSNFSRKLRKPFDEKAVAAVKSAIAKIKTAREG